MQKDDIAPEAVRIRAAKGIKGPWAHLDQETRERYEGIERRVREKWERGEI